ncbi:hypothetical protein BGI36_04835 [Snodgrassella communis]|uniref:hypothetical protein n=1 Tax=Snodgrassella communis TaxID=2946699 RepID=UPI000C1F2A19|nr:hypothetical protein [Snodgrassella communis]PIT21916.1 hypothetical protein BGI36_04835 [Snodgrassella communis]
MKKNYKLFLLTLLMSGCVHAISTHKAINNVVPKTEFFPLEYSSIRYVKGMELTVPKNMALNAPENCILILKTEPQDDTKKVHRVYCFSTFPKKLVVPKGCILKSKYYVYKSNNYKIKQPTFETHTLECGSNWVETAAQQIKSMPNSVYVEERLDGGRKGRIFLNTWDPN